MSVYRLKQRHSCALRRVHIHQQVTHFRYVQKRYFTYGVNNLPRSLRIEYKVLCEDPFCGEVLMTRRRVAGSIYPPPPLPSPPHPWH